MKHLALCWADNKIDNLRQFDFIFHIALKNVRNNENIEDIIVRQHKGLKSRQVSPGEIKRILESNGAYKVLILFDGHDEYTPGTNQHIDNAITKDSLADCWIILTSRETKQLIPLREYMNAEAEIKGFDSEGVREYMTKCLGSTDKQTELMIIAKKSRMVTSVILDSDSKSDEDSGNDSDNNIEDDSNTDSQTYDDSMLDDFYDFGILCIPILLHMICVLYLRKVSLPLTRTGIMSAIVERCPDWEEIRKTGQTRVKAIEKALTKLSDFVLHKILAEDATQMFDKVEIVLSPTINES